MFARTERLLLRPGWAEDAPALAAAIADEMIVRNLATAPWPYSLRDAEAFLAQPRDPVLPVLPDLRADDGRARLVGSAGLADAHRGQSSSATGSRGPIWGRGYATEAGRALIDIARDARLHQLEGSHFLDNPASGRVLEKLGFEPLGITAPRMSCARGTEAQARLLRLQLADETGAEEDERWRPRPRCGPSCAERAPQSRRRSPHRRGAARGRPRSTGGSRAGRI